MSIIFLPTVILLILPCWSVIFHILDSYIHPYITITINPDDMLPPAFTYKLSVMNPDDIHVTYP